MMALTREEALLAAEVAEQYPPGYGRMYGHSERLMTDSLGGASAEFLRTHPRAGAYG